MKKIGIWVILAGIVICSACSAAPEDKPDAVWPTPASSAQSAQSASPTQLPSGGEETSPTQPAGPGGISYEEDLQINPPMPQNLRATQVADGILLEWSAPVPAAVAHAYSDTPAYYRIYRRVENGPAEPIAQSQGLQYLDKSAQPGIQYYYQVSAVHENNLEGTRTDAVKAPVR